MRDRMAAVGGELTARRVFALHRRGAFDAWQKTGDITKRMLIGPKMYPGRPFAGYHQEALRWWDAFLKGLDTGVLEEGPIRLWIRGDDVWRQEREWPLARTEFSDWYRAAGGGRDEAALRPRPEEWLFGQPEAVFRSAPLDAPLEITGPIQLDLVMNSTAEDADWIAVLADEAPDGTVTELTRGHLRSSRRAVDAALSRRNEPHHPHDRSEPLPVGRAGGSPDRDRRHVQRVPAGPSLRLQLSNCDSKVRPGAMINYRKVLRIPAVNTILTGPRGSRISLPNIPR